nr:hypothetical protein Iba_chr03fCG2690 [Ipomoea batatas]
MVSRRCNFSKVGETVPTGGVVSPSLMRSRETKRRSRRCLGIPHLKCLGPARRLLDPQTRLENLLPKGRRHYPHGGEWHRYHIASRTGRPRMHPLGNLEVVGSKEREAPCAVLLGRQGRLERIYDGFERAERVIRVENVESENHDFLVGRERMESRGGRHKKRINRKDRYIVRNILDERNHGGVRNWRVDGDGAGDRIPGNIHRPEITRRPAGRLEKRGHEFPGRRDATEVGPRKVLEEDVVAENVGDIGGGREEGVGDGEESEGGAGVEIGDDISGGEKGGEVGEIRVRGEESGDINGE